jgi:hypothetical protein
MGEIGILATRGLLGGIMVAVFALMGEVVTPKAFSGLFSAAPSVAVASLAITAVVDGATGAKQSTVGMVVGGVGITACCILAAAAIPRIGALWGSAVSWLAWAVVSLGLYWAVFIGAH